MRDCTTILNYASRPKTAKSFNVSCCESSRCGNRIGGTTSYGSCKIRIRSYDWTRRIHSSVCRRRFKYQHTWNYRWMSYISSYSLASTSRPATLSVPFVTCADSFALWSLTLEDIYRWVLHQLPISCLSISSSLGMKQYLEMTEW